MERIMPHTFTFTYEIERDDDVVELEVEYEVSGKYRDDRHVEITCIMPDIATDEEEKAILERARERVEEDIIDAESAEGDYRYDEMRERQMGW